LYGTFVSFLCIKMISTTDIRDFRRTQLHPVFLP
jgi:hypothetical protein